jgi:flagellar hook protein FlgE
MSFIHNLRSGVTGLKGHQVKLDTIGNNIANIATTGFKKSSVTFFESFQEAVYSGIDSANASSTINPTVNGFGITQPHVRIDTRSGSYQETGNPLDLAIKDNGYFLLKQEDELLFSRDGNFVVNKNNELIQRSSGTYVAGWPAEFNADGDLYINTDRPLEPIAFKKIETMPFKSTTEIVFRSNLDKSSTARNIKDSSVPKFYPIFTDSTGQEHIIRQQWSQKSSRVFEQTVLMDDKAVAKMNLTVDPWGNIKEWEVSGDMPEGTEITTDENGKPLYASWPTEVTDTEGNVNQEWVSIDFPDTPYKQRYNDEIYEADIQNKIYRHKPGVEGFESLGDKVDLVGSFESAKPYSLLGDVFDDKGVSHEVSISFEHVDELRNGWEYRFNLPKDDPIIANWMNENKDILQNPDNPTNFDLDRANDAVFGGSRTGYMQFAFSGYPDPATSDIKKVQTLNSMIPENSGGISLDLNVDMITGFAGAYSTRIEKVDGYAEGKLTKESITSTGDGVLQAHYSNGQTTTVAQLGLSTFTNTSGLVKAGQNLFRMGRNSGMTDDSIGLPGSVPRGLVLTGFLESSNVDILDEFTDMITTQRAFQANSKAVSTSDNILQTAINIKK